VDTLTVKCVGKCIQEVHLVEVPKVKRWT